MRAKLLAASLFCVVCVSGTAAHAGSGRSVVRLFELLGFVGRSARVAEVTTARDLETITLVRRAYRNSDLLSKYRDNPNLIITKKPNLDLEDDFSAMRRVYDGDALRSLKALDEELAATHGPATAKDSQAAKEAASLETEMNKLRFSLDATIASSATYCGLTKCYGHALRAASENEKRKREGSEPTEAKVNDALSLE
jgi:hypothetical protein